MNVSLSENKPSDGKLFNSVRVGRLLCRTTILMVLRTYFDSLNKLGLVSAVLFKMHRRKLVKISRGLEARGSEAVEGVSVFGAPWRVRSTSV